MTQEHREASVPDQVEQPTTEELEQMLDGTGRRSVIRWLVKREIERRKDPYAEYK